MKRFVPCGFLLVLVLTMSSGAHATVIELPSGGDLRAAIASLAGQPGAIQLGDGIYEVADSIELASGQSIHGRYDRSTIRWTGGAVPIFKIVGDAVPSAAIGTLSPNTEQMISITATATGLVRIVDQVRPGMIRHEDNEIVMTAAGLALKRRPALLYANGATLYPFRPATGVTLEDLVIEGAAASLGVYASYTSDVRVRRCTITGTDIGVYVGDSYRSAVEDSKIVGSRQTALRVDGSTGGTFRGNTILDSVTSAIVLASGTWMFHIVNNAIYGTGVTGLSGLVTGGDAITVDGAGDVIIEGNRIFGTNCYGIWIAEAVERTIIANNLIAGGITAGILINAIGAANVRNTIISSNIIHNNNGGSIGMYPANGAVLAANIYDTIRGGGIGGADDPTAVFVGNLASGY